MIKSLFTSLGMFKNTRRDKESQPQLSNGKPQDIGGKRYWVSAFINTKDPATQERVEKFLDALTKENGSKPIITISLKEAEQKSPSGYSGAGRSAGYDEDDDPF